MFDPPAATSNTIHPCSPLTYLPRCPAAPQRSLRRACSFPGRSLWVSHCMRHRYTPHPSHPAGPYGSPRCTASSRGAKGQQVRPKPSLNTISGCNVFWCLWCSVAAPRALRALMRATFYSCWRFLLAEGRALSALWERCARHTNVCACFAWPWAYFCSGLVFGFTASFAGRFLGSCGSCRLA